MSRTLHQEIDERSVRTLPDIGEKCTNGSKCLVKDRKLGVSYSWKVRETSQYHHPFRNSVPITENNPQISPRFYFTV